ncbi:hypothetical protein [Streptomyces telluris]|uniref:Uncharacterized protein n=1 Tax=Streptomyces telluris TaxID=2720021 RepID=A0A9X2LMT4_9ACTN|nr:hypothetical protein [Streptomyces telluris]MCQ8774063.1 hypothetical protein [Streptomyces telluris]
MASQPLDHSHQIVKRHLCVAADVEKYSHHDIPSQAVIQTDLVRVLEEAALLSGLDRASWARQAQGDQELAVLPVGVPEPVVLGAFTRHLAVRIGDRNAARAPKERMRLRLAVGIGVASLAALGYAGPAPVAVARYVNAPQVKAVLAAIRAANLVVIVSGQLYEDVVKSRTRGLDPEQYVRIHVRQQEFSAYGWIHVPGHAADEVRSVVQDMDPACPDGPRSSVEPVKPTLAHHDRSQHVVKGIAFQGSVNRDLNFGFPAEGSACEPEEAW